MLSLRPPLCAANTYLSACKPCLVVGSAISRVQLQNRSHLSAWCRGSSWTTNRQFCSSTDLTFGLGTPHAKHFGFSAFTDTVLKCSLFVRPTAHNFQWMVLRRLSSSADKSPSSPPPPPSHSASATSRASSKSSSSTSLPSSSSSSSSSASVQLDPVHLGSSGLKLFRAAQPKRSIAGGELAAAQFEFAAAILEGSAFTRSSLASVYADLEDRFAAAFPYIKNSALKGHPQASELLAMKLMQELAEDFHRGKKKSESEEEFKKLKESLQRRLNQIVAYADIARKDAEQDYTTVSKLQPAPKASATPSKSSSEASKPSSSYSSTPSSTSASSSALISEEMFQAFIRHHRLELVSGKAKLYLLDVRLREIEQRKAALGSSSADEESKVAEAESRAYQQNSEIRDRLDRFLPGFENYLNQSERDLLNFAEKEKQKSEEQKKAETAEEDRKAANWLARGGDATVDESDYTPPASRDPNDDELTALQLIHAKDSELYCEVQLLMAAAWARGPGKDKKKVYECLQKSGELQHQLQLDDSQMKQLTEEMSAHLNDSKADADGDDELKKDSKEKKGKIDKKDEEESEQKSGKEKSTHFGRGNRPKSFASLARAARPRRPKK